MLTTTTNGNFIAVMRDDEQVGFVYVERFRPSVSKGTDFYQCYVQRRGKHGASIRQVTRQSLEDAVNHVYDNGQAV